MEYRSSGNRWTKSPKCDSEAPIAGEVFYSINSGAKQSLYRNHLSMAEATGYVQIRPLHVVTEIKEYDNERFRIVCNQINEQGVVVDKKTIVCRYLFLTAGSIGTTKLLLRAKNNGKLQHLSQQVGKFWGTNGDASGIVVTSRQTNPTQGSPAVTVIEDFDNPISPVVLEQVPIPGVPEGAYAFLSLAITKPEGYFTYDVSKQTANLVWPKNSVNNQKKGEQANITLDVQQTDPRKPAKVFAKFENQIALPKTKCDTKKWLPRASHIPKTP